MLILGNQDFDVLFGKDFHDIVTQYFGEVLGQRYEIMLEYAW
jgi:hypothetical protein